MKLNLGCGPHVSSGWVNVDYAFGAHLMKLPGFRSINRKLGLFEMDWDKNIVLHDLTKKFPWSEDSVDQIYSSHTLEHLSRMDGLHFLKESHRVLKEDGVLRIVVPDLAYTVSQYSQGEMRADHFVESLGVLCPEGPRGLKAKLQPLICFPHKCMYDETTLISILEELEFSAQPKCYLESEIEDIESVELEHRTIHAVIVEGKKRPLNSNTNPPLS
jgi:hypothetical protein